MEFARNPGSSGSSSDLLCVFDTGEIAPLWLLVDAALVDEERGQTLAASLKWSLSNVLQGSPLEHYGAHAPQLIEIPRDRASASLGPQRFMALNPQAPTFSVIEWTASLTDLSRLCAYLAQVRAVVVQSQPLRVDRTGGLTQSLAKIARP